ncbi:TetR/AcrR family transcriptional regulator [Streptomyces sp. ET3-23]|uniref:TetR/AcrR family transcriptional regulator n=1 Tax=Streptomyces sp. ET3-23 TaxID=2885643 RepID=UPI001D10162A|nr:TetR/AcrR family transcriptional regulator [Streptomyces sp. ET3-23]MCC2276090.1 TetR/AcrR family transcriptional regulator [Streptomyces sp. ET3-23]
MNGKEQHAETVRLLWGSRPGPARGPRRTLDLGRIAQAGIEVADAEGLDAVSMQRVAALLGVTKMALYRYVPGKAELISLMVDASLGPAPAPVEGEGWRAQLDDWARRLFAAFRLHPWVLDATVGPRVMGPMELSWMERAVAALDGTRLGGAQRMDAAVLLVNHARGIAAQTRAAGSEGAEPEKELGAVLAQLMQEHGERFPALAAAFASASEPGGGRDQAWEFGLERILDGLAVLIDDVLVEDA